MRADTHKTTTVGLVIALGLVLAAVGILTVGREEGFFRDRISFSTDFPNVDGLAVGAPVRLIGVEVGTVSRITLLLEAEKQEVDVEFTVDRMYRERIRVGTTATLKSLTYLSGEKYVELIPGNGDELIPEGGYVDSPTSEVAQLIEGSKNIAANIEEISNEFRKLLEYLGSGETILSRLIQDPEFGSEPLEQISSTLGHINTVVARIDNGEGLIGRLLLDEEFASQTTERIDAVLARLEAVAARVDSGEGFLGQLLAEDSELLRTQEELSGLVASARQVMERLESGRGLAGRILSDDDQGRTIMARLDAMMADMAQILGKIDSGEGTLGRLINEPELYDQATDVVGGVADSRFMRWVARRVRNKQIKDKIRRFADELEQAEQAGAGPEGQKP